MSDPQEISERRAIENKEMLVALTRCDQESADFRMKLAGTLAVLASDTELYLRLSILPREDASVAVSYNTNPDRYSFVVKTGDEIQRGESQESIADAMKNSVRKRSGR